ncbi:MAG: AAA family ATPase [Pseudomonadota bacterium]
MTDLRRIMIVGAAGSGKSTLARMLGQRLGLPVYHMDRDVYWLPGWEERETADRIARVEKIAARDAWVFEGSFSQTYGTRAARADVLIWLDTPLALRLLRVVRRQIRHSGQTRPDMAEGCPEKVSMLPGFLWFMWRTARSSRRKARAVFKTMPRDRVRLTSARAVNAYVARLGA